jgi:TetR/AcrR family transcriptional regulator, regulator of cefoperazone and chloramphenicol sensitivity
MDPTRERLLIAAGEVFAEKGFDKATVREICQAANVQNIAAVNYYFGDKERLYIESVKRAHQVQIEQVPLPQWNADTPPEQKLRGFIQTMVARLTGDSWLPWQEQLMMREVANPTAAVAELVQQFIRPHFELLLTIIDELIPSATPEIKRHQIAFSIVGQCLHYKVARPFIKLLVGQDETKAYTHDQLSEHIFQFSLDALKGLGKNVPNSTTSKQRSNSPRTAAPRRKNPHNTKASS